MGNYSIIELPTYKEYVKKGGSPFTLAEAKKEIAHAHCFGIRNVTTGKLVVFHTYNGFIFPLDMIRQFPDRCNSIVNKWASFTYHPQQD